MSICSLSLPQEHGRCHWCRKALRGRQTRWCSRFCAADATRNHRWTQAKAAAKKRRMQVLFQCEECDEWVEKVEVNHIVPCLGKHGVWGCHHHQDNLEVLCVPCHRAKTKQQRESGLFPKRGKK